MADRKGLLRSVEPWERAYGVPYPLGVTLVEELQAYNLALYSRHATGVTLLLFREDNPAVPVHTLRFDPLNNKTGRTWHAMVPQAEAHGATLYAYRVEGPNDPGAGHRFDPEKVLVDPYAPTVFFPPAFDRAGARLPGPNDGRAPLGVLPTQAPPFEWGRDVHPRHGHDTIIYELHVKGFTARGNSGVTPAKRGTFAGLIEKIPYLAELGVTAVELLPVHQFDPQEGNYWGYMTLHFFSPHRSYSCGDPAAEFKAMVKAFHQAGIEVLLDVVYNHTTEGDETGPTYSFRGIDNSSYYLLQPDRRRYSNDTGCGNTMRTAHPAVRALVLESLRYWVQEMHIDGFRFDLASIFSRTGEGTQDLDAPAVISEIGYFAYARDVRLIAEAWDISAYQLGRSFPGFTWLQWNGKFRDDIRAFVKGDPGKVGDLIQRLYGSDDLFPDTAMEAYRPSQSVNFIAAHDGFCLYDIVAYNRKHNEANGHGNTDGTDDNRSWNCGWEGDENAPPEVLALRRRQVKNFCCLLMLANGTPMLVAGDEFLHTQRGNNNPYNQDNEITWLDWDRLEQHRDVFRFFQLMIAFRKAHPSIGRWRFWREDVRWHGVGPDVDLSRDSHTLAYFLRGSTVGDDDLYVMINAYWEDLIFSVQEGEAGAWRRVVDTSLDSPEDFVESEREPRLESLAYPVRARSVVLLRRPRS